MVLVCFYSGLTPDLEFGRMFLTERTKMLFSSALHGGLLSSNSLPPVSRLARRAASSLCLTHWRAIWASRRLGPLAVLELVFLRLLDQELTQPG